MSNYDIKPKVSKDYVLSLFSQEQIFEYYLGIRVETGVLIKNPTRDDKHPTANFFYKNGTLYFKDFAGKGFHYGDCFNLVQEIEGCDFMGAMIKILKDMKGEANLPPGFIFEAKENTQKEIKIKVRNWRQEDKEFWQPYFIRIVDLEEYWVDPVEYAWINNVLRYEYDEKDRCYSYYFGEGRRKLYLPDRAIMRFRQNSEAVQGFRQLPSKGDLCILTKSLKDVLVLRRLGFASCALQSESHTYTRALYDELSSRFTHQVVFYDNDEAGRKFASKIYNEYEIPPIEVPKIYDIKDISDFVKDRKSLDGGKKLVDTLIKEVL